LTSIKWAPAAGVRIAPLPQVSGTSSFLRLKLGEALQRRHAAPHIYESAEDARAHLREMEQKISA
jgi:hypothetical protein